MSKNSENELAELPTVLSYKRSISQGRALMYACEDHEGKYAEPLIVSQVSLRGTKSFDVWKNLRKADEESLGEKSMEDVSSHNPHQVETAVMPEDRPFLKACFTLKYMPNSRLPHMANNTVIESMYRALFDGYSRLGGFNYLGQLYVEPLVMGRWMWRNNDEALSRRIVIKVLAGAHEQVFKFQLPFGASEMKSLDQEQQESAHALGHLIGQALSGSISLLALSVEAVYHLGGGMQAYPSQEMVVSERSKDSPARVFYKVSQGGVRNQAALSEQKIGNALRTIDCWHRDPLYGVQPVEPLGVVSMHQTSTRVQHKKDFYSLCKKNLKIWSTVLRDANDLAAVKDPDCLHFIMAVLVRGGAFV